MHEVALLIAIAIYWPGDGAYIPVRSGDGQCFGREAQCGRRTKINWTKTDHRTRVHFAGEWV